MTSVPVVVPTYVGYAPRLDGKITDQAWAGASKIGDFRLIASGELATQRTELRVCYDRTTLYLAFECFEDQMDGITAKFTEDGTPVWLDDSVEVFVSPYAVADPAKSHQFVVNAAGAKTYVRPDWVRDREHWRAAVIRLRDRWVAEIAIPFDILRPLGRNEPCWRVNFCRNEFPHGEASSWSVVPKWFSACSHFGRMVAPEAPFQFSRFRGKPVRIAQTLPVPVGIEPLAAHGDRPTLDYIVPEPQEVHRRLSKDPFRIGPSTRIVVNDDAGESDMWTAEEINAAIQRLGAERLEVVHSHVVGPDPEAAANCIVVGESVRNRLLRAICERDAVRIPRSRFGTGAYALDVLTDRVAIAGSSSTETYYGAQTLKQLLRTDTDGSLFIPALNIRDFSRFAFRGVHLLSSRDALSYITKLIENVLAPLKINHIVLQTDQIAWASHPEITDQSNAMPREDVAKLLEVARRHRITVTPLVQSPGHLEWAFRNGQNLDIAEDPEHPFCYCMSNPRSHEFIFSIMDEAIELFDHPEYLHAGRDEFDMIGRVPFDGTCAAVGKERLYIEDTVKVHDHLASRGCKMMMWGDVLAKYGYREMIDRLPKDILINDWRYAPSIEYPSVEFYQSHGFPVVGATWYDPRNIFTFSNYAGRRAIQGMLQTTWTGWKTGEEILRDHADQVYAYVFSSAWAWNPVRPAMDALPYRPDTVFGRLWCADAAETGPDYSVIRLDRLLNISRIDSGRAIGWLGIGRGNDLRGMPEGLVEFEGTPFLVPTARLDEPSAIMLGGSAIMDQFPARVEGIEVNAKLSALDFLHGCAFSADVEEKVGSYVVHYADGETATIDLIYAKTIFAWDDQSTAMSYGFAWRGRAQDGRLVGVSELRWTNPRPEVAVSTIDFVSDGTEASPFLLALTAER